MSMIHDTTLSAALRHLPADSVQQPQQQRSRDRQKALLSVGLKLTENADWDQVTIAEIAAQSGFSVGSFYTRFRDKQAYLDALMAIVAEQVQGRMDEFVDGLRAQGGSYDGTLTQFVEQAIQTHVRLRGIFRISVLLRDKSRAGNPFALPQVNPRPDLDPIPWQAGHYPHPFTQMRLYSCAQFVNLMLTFMACDDEQTRLRLNFAHQMMNSMLVNSLLTDPGPLHIEDVAYQQQLILCIRAHLASQLKTRLNPD